MNWVALCFLLLVFGVGHFSHLPFPFVINRLKANKLRWNFRTKSFDWFVLMIPYEWQRKMSRAMVVVVVVRWWWWGGRVAAATATKKHNEKFKATEWKRDAYKSRRSININKAENQNWRPVNCKPLESKKKSEMAMPYTECEFCKWEFHCLSLDVGLPFVRFVDGK